VKISIFVIIRGSNSSYGAPFDPNYIKIQYYLMFDNFFMKFRKNMDNYYEFVKGIGSILFFKNGLKKNCSKNSINNLRRNNYEVCTVVVRCFPNILDAMVLENV
jgi:hypothetical protein